MSAIFGICSPEGRPVNPEAIEGMAAALSHRGPDGVAITIDGSAALGIQMMHITPEDALGGVPFVSHSLSITATSRLDNREELLRFLEIPLAAETPMTDARLILSAYQHWGTSCCEHLLGDFAFAIWDERRAGTNRRFPRPDSVVPLGQGQVHLILGDILDLLQIAVGMGATDAVSAQLTRFQPQATESPMHASQRDVDDR